MRTLARLASLALVGALLLSTNARAAESVVGQGDLDRAISERISTETAERQAIRTVLGRDEVTSVARQMGLDLKQASSAVDTLSGEELQRLADQATAIDQALAGGDTTIQISLVVALLVIIIIILLVK